MARDKGSGSVHQLKNGKWRGTIEAGYTRSGARRRVSVTARTKREALQRLKDKQRELLRYGAPDETTSQNLTVKKFADSWLELQQTRLSPSAYTASRIAIERWIIPTVGKRRITQVSAGDVRKVATEVLRAGNVESTALRYQQVFIKMLKDAATDGIPIPQAALLVETVKANVPDRTDIPLQDARRILEVAATRPDFSRWLAAFYAGLRPAEARGLTWDRVNLDEGLLEVSWQLKPLPYNVARDRTSGFRVPRGYESINVEDAYHLVRPKTKSGDRWIPMIPALVSALRLWKPLCPSRTLVWPNLTGKFAYGKPREDKADRDEWKRISGFAGAVKPDGTLYDLYAARHTCATMMREAGAPDEVLIAIMGHSTILSSRTYMHTSQVAASNWLNTAMEGLPAPEIESPMITI